MRYLAALAVALGLGLALVALPAPAFASGPYNICANVTSQSICLRDPSDGGSGTPVEISAISDLDSEEFSLITDSRCGGTVTDGSDGTTPCPFTDTNIDKMFNGKPIYVLKQETSKLCVRIDLSSGLGVMGDCDAPPTLSEPSSAFVFDVLCGGSCNAYVSVGATNSDNNGSVSYLENDQHPNDQTYASTDTSIAGDYQYVLVPA
jgi:hypothetical protein